MKIEENEVIEAYLNGQSMTSLAKKLHTYPTSIKRVLEKNNIKLRHDTRDAGKLYVQDGEKLIEWAKKQGRLVTKTELAKLIGTKRLSPSYFEKYPELGQYVVTHEQNEIQKYCQKLYKWLQENNILYKPNDRTKIKMSVTALLLDSYSNIILQIAIKPKCISEKKYSKDMIERKNRACEQNMRIIFLDENIFENLDELKDLLH